jgi:hypothetical protein
MTKTKFANNVNPFTGLKVGAVDVSKLRISNDPILRARAVPLSKYDAVFSALKPGQCIVCEDGSAPKIKTALDKWLAKAAFGCWRTNEKAQQVPAQTGQL